MNFLFGDEATIKRATGLVPALSTDMMDLISTWRDIYSGKPAWAENRDWDKTTNFAKVVCQDIAGKACNEFEISTGDDELDAEILHTISAVLPDKVEAALALGAIVPRPYYNPDTKSIAIDWYTADRVVPVAWDAGELVSAILTDYAKVDKDHTYIKLETHQMKRGASIGENVYTITTKAFSYADGTLGNEVSLSEIPQWANITPEITINNLERPLFVYMKTPFTNNLDMSPTGISFFANALDQLEEIDRTFSTMTWEREATKAKTFVDESMIPQRYDDDGKLVDDLSAFDRKFYKKLAGRETAENLLEVSTPTPRLASYKDHMQAVLSYACTIMQLSSNAYTTDAGGMPTTAKQVLSEDKRTYNTVLGIQNKMIIPALHSLLASVRALQTLYDVSPRLPENDDGITIKFGDSIMIDEETERQQALSEVKDKVRSKLSYLIEYRGLSEEEARKELEEISNEEPSYDFFGSGEGA